MCIRDRFGGWWSGNGHQHHRYGERGERRDCVLVGTDDTIAAATTTLAGVFLPAEKTKLTGVETGATADQTDAEIKTAYEANADTNAFTDADETKLDGIATGAQVNVGTDLSFVRDNNSLEVKSSTGTNVDLPAATDSLVGVFLPAEKVKLTGIETGATADQTASEIKTAYESNSDTNAFTDADESKLDGIATGAEVNVQADLLEESSSTNPNLSLIHI